MSRDYNTIKVFSIIENKLVEAFLFNGILSSNIDDYQFKWLPIFNEAKERLRKKKYFIEDAGWDWNYNVAVRQGYLAFEGYVIEINDETQGMMLTNNTNYTSKIEKGKPLVYIEYLAVAPWNRRIMTPGPKYKLVGTNLLYQAIGESFERGFEGRIGLHSLPGAISWYKKLGLSDLGKQDKNMEYFELDKKTATSLLNDLNK